EVSQFYDPMIAKLIVHETSREAAAARLADACGEVEVWPVRTNAGFLKRCLEHPRFVAGDVDTGFIGAEEDALVAGGVSGDMGLIGATLMLGGLPHRVGRDDAYASSPWGAPYGVSGFRLNSSSTSPVSVSVDGRTQTVSLTQRHGDIGIWSSIDGRELHLDYDPETSSPLVQLGARRFHYEPWLNDDYLVFVDGNTHRVAMPRYDGAGRGASTSDGALRAPMPGKIVATPAKAGDAVVKGQPVIVLEAMKMEHALTAPFDGVVGEVNAAVGDQVGADALLAVVAAASE
ncbi:MAG: biotin/lipoyl-containing protein, partial [Niveispirillum sp.]